MQYYCRQCTGNCSSVCLCDWTQATVSSDETCNAQLLLASSSAYRAQLLKRLNLSFLTLTPELDEAAKAGETPQELALRLAAEKAKAVSVPDSSGLLVIGSDQVASINGERLHKPGSRYRAIEQLMQMQGHAVTFFTAVCVWNAASGESFTALDETTTRLRMLEAAEIERYVEADNPLDCAGSFKVESLGISLFESVSSEDPTALIGLPMISLCKGLRQLGVNVP